MNYIFSQASNHLPQFFHPACLKHPQVLTQRGTANASKQANLLSARDPDFSTTEHPFSCELSDVDRRSVTA